jgi:hypothetical protein
MSSCRTEQYREMPLSSLGREVGIPDKCRRRQVSARTIDTGQYSTESAPLFTGSNRSRVRKLSRRDRHRQCVHSSEDLDDITLYAWPLQSILPSRSIGCHCGARFGSQNQSWVIPSVCGFYIGEPANKSTLLLHILEPSRWAWLITLASVRSGRRIVGTH